MPNAVSLFSGCGGSDAGAQAAGFTVVMANDLLPYARDVYLANHAPTDYVLGDVRGIARFPRAELLLGCYPCQGFSQGGVRDPTRRINQLYREFARALNLIKPKAFVVENVAGMTRSNYDHLLTDQLCLFREAGYRVHWQVLNAADFGLAQERKRIFIVGLHDRLGLDYVFPTPTHGTCGQPAKTTIQQALKGMPLWPRGEYCDQPFHWYYLSRNRRRDWHDTAPTMVANYRHMPLHPVSPPLKKYGNDDWRFMTDAPARRFSYREAAALQGFGRNMRFPDSPAGTLAMRYKVVGNAVPPPLFEAVVRTLPEVWD